MAYKIKKGLFEYLSSSFRFDGLATSKDVNSAYKLALKNAPDFYELEPVEVIDVYLDEDAPHFPQKAGTQDPDWLKYGWINARKCFPEDGEVSDIECRPLDSNIKQYPHPGEYVIYVEYLGKKYYTQKLNYWNSVNENRRPGLSTPMNPHDDVPIPMESFITNTDIREVKAYEGDIIFNGRFGQSIRFGSDDTYLTLKQKEKYPKGGPIDGLGMGSEFGYASNILLRTGQSEVPTLNYKPVLEDINKDGSSIWMTTNQIVGLEFSNTIPEKWYTNKEKKGGEGVSPVDNLAGNQIILNSDRIIFNAKKQAILMTSPTAIGISANKEIGLEVPPDGRVQLGQSLSNQPAICGDQLMVLIESLIDTLMEFARDASGTVSTAIGFTLPVTITIPTQKLLSQLEYLKTRMEEPKSKAVFVGHMIGPKT